VADRRPVGCRRLGDNARPLGPRIWNVGAEGKFDAEVGVPRGVSVI
jgi:hypothetical protein